MRVFRAFVVSVLSVGVLIGSASLPAAAAPPAPPFSALTVDVTGSAPGNAAVTGGAVHLLTTDHAIEVSGDVDNGISTVRALAQISPVSGETLVPGVHPVATGITGSVDITVTTGTGPFCFGSSGTVTILQADSATDGTITALAANYDIACSNGDHASGSTRVNTSSPYQAVATSLPNWDFGVQPIARNGAPKSFRFTNEGPAPETFGTARISGTTTAFSVTSDTCSGQLVAGGDSCTLSVVPHPRTASVESTARLSVPLTDLPDHVVDLRTAGLDGSPFYATPGPNRVQVVWQALPTPFGAVVTSYRVYRGTSPTQLGRLRDVGSTTFTDYTVTPGRTYYYALLPIFDNGRGGDRTGTVAAIAWPRYTAGMLHRFTSPTREISNARLVAGRTYSPAMLGLRGIPRSGVSALALQIVASRGTATTAITAYPYGTARPGAADVVVPRGANRAGFAIVRIGRSGRISLASTHGTVTVSLDVAGYYSTTALTHSAGYGSAQQTFVQPGALVDTRAQGGALKGGYYFEVGAPFADSVKSHVRALVLTVTAIGGLGGGTVSIGPAGRAPTSTVALGYSAHTVTANTAIIATGSYTSQSGIFYPGVSVLNNGTHAIQLIISVDGYYDDDTMVGGERYTPTTAVHLLSARLGQRGTRVISPGSHAGARTTAMSSKLIVSGPSRSTAEAIWPRGISGIGAPANPQARAVAGQSSATGVLVATGVGNTAYLRNSTGVATVNLWSFGHFDYYPIARANGYLAGRPGGIRPHGAALNGQPAVGPARSTR